MFCLGSCQSLRLSLVLLDQHFPITTSQSFFCNHTIFGFHSVGFLEVKSVHIGFCVIHWLHMKSVLPMNIGGLTHVKCKKETGSVMSGFFEVE